MSAALLCQSCDPGITIRPAPPQEEGVDIIVADKCLANVSVDKLPSTNNIKDNNLALLQHLQVVDYVIKNPKKNHDYVLIDSYPEISDVLRSIIYASDHWAISSDDLLSYFDRTRPSRTELLRVLEKLDCHPGGEAQKSLYKYAARQISETDMFQRVARQGSRQNTD